jgi:hypothetical protein
VQLTSLSASREIEIGWCSQHFILDDNPSSGSAIAALTNRRHSWAFACYDALSPSRYRFTFFTYVVSFDLFCFF